VASGLAALLVSTVPLWVVLLEWVGPERRRPRFLTLAGVAVGLFGVFLLVGSGPEVGEGVDPVGGIVLVLASLSWAFGSVISRRLPLPSAPRIATAAEMLTGGGLLLLLGLVVGETGRVSFEGVSAVSWIALGYLIVFGSLAAFSAYVWLLKVADTAKVATYAYVNPVVALLLGWAMAGEELTGRTLAAASIILLAVVVITTVRSGRQKGCSQREREAR
jgi:drug/metabolite transporter (DMT)-like permease